MYTIEKFNAVLEYIEGNFDGVIDDKEISRIT